MSLPSEIVDNLKKRYSESLIAIYGVGSYFDTSLPDDWVKNDIDLIVVLKELTKTPKQDWTDVRFEQRHLNDIEVWIGYNTLQGLLNKQFFQKESFSNYEWSILDIKVPENSQLLFGEDIRSKIPDIDELDYDFDDILRRSLYHLDKSYKVQMQEQDLYASKMSFTKAVFKFSFYLCIYFNENYQKTSLRAISKSTQKLVRRGRIDDFFMEFLKESIEFRRKQQFTQDFHPLRTKFTQYIFSLLGKGTIHRKMNYYELLRFLEQSFEGFKYLIKFAKKLKSKYADSSSSLDLNTVISIQNESDLKRIAKQVKNAFSKNQNHMNISSIRIPIENLERNKRFIEILEFRFVEHTPTELRIFKNSALYAKLIKNKFHKI